MVYGICRAMLRDVYEAEDATQQVFLSAHKALLGGATVRDPGGWLATIARNECRGRIAAGMRRPLPVADEDLDSIPDTGDDLTRHAQREEIRSALAELPERQREAVILRYLYGLRYGEVATALGLSRPATEALLFRARRALRSSLRPVAGAVLAVPVAVREQLALALPGFEERAAPVVVGAGVAGGVLAKLAAGGASVKVATATVAVATVGAVGTVGPERSAVPRAEAVVEQAEDVDRSGALPDDSSGSEEDRSAHGHGADDPERVDDDGSGSGPGTTNDDRERDDGNRAADNSGSGNAGNDAEAAEDRSGSSNDRVETTEISDTSDSSGPNGSGSTSSGSSSSGTGGSGSSGPGNGDDERGTTEPDASNDSSGPGSADDDEERSGEN